MSHPQLLVDALSQIHPVQLAGGEGEMGGGDKIAEQLADVILQTKKSAIQ